ncbi:hypothetical protein AJ80_01849 [Polytolypa hystricis UAMH7299]|uniref:Uncharacterized protein n=1 Tax=Polytolypa hystricis (strain UAMH7299) TaxID=1447883 RepID=A0A2B7YYY2_POLH7|nr:hypothetical protein AJ80_01849 [Polytolypa hystricis UAMH7299]
MKSNLNTAAPVVVAVAIHGNGRFHVDFRLSQEQEGKDLGSGGRYMAGVDPDLSPITPLTCPVSHLFILPPGSVMMDLCGLLWISG